jgi:hypothetical protein
MLGASPAVFAQDKEVEEKIPCASVPAPARAAFQKLFPNALITRCAKEMEKDRIAYEISSREGKIRRDVLFFEDGSLIVVEETIDYDRIPAPVRQALEKVYPRRAVKLSETATRGSSVLYEFQIRHQGKDIEIVFDPSGNEVSRN